VAAWLTARGYKARRHQGADGAAPGDIDLARTIPGLLIDVKAREECKPGSWMLEAERQASGSDDIPVVVYHPPGVGDPGKWIWMLRSDEALDVLAFFLERTAIR